MFLFNGDENKCKELIGFALQERFVSARHGRMSGHKVFSRNVQFDNGAYVTTLFNGTSMISVVSYPTTKVDKVKGIKSVDQQEFTFFYIDLVSAAVAYRSLYMVTSKNIRRLSSLKLKENKYILFNSYYTKDVVNYDRAEESCNSIINGVSNVSADNIYVDSTSHKDDWHRKKFLWVAYPINWVGTYTVNAYSQTWGHPGLQAGSTGSGFHWSHSPYTYGAEANRSHYSRGIDLEKRVYRPGRVDLTVDGDNKTYLMTETSVKQYGKTPWTRDSNARLSRYNERIESSGVGTWTMNQTDDNWLMYLWPFIPYLWEIPYFFIYSWNRNDTVYGQCYLPETGTSSKQWSYNYTNISGTTATSVVSTDAATFNGTPVVTTTVTAPRPHYVWIGGSPVLVDGPLNNTWVDTTESSNTWSCSVEKTVPIGPVGNGKTLTVMNKVILSGSYSYQSEATHTKVTDFGDGVYLFPPTYTEMWGLGSWTDSSTIQRTENTSYDISGSSTSELKIGSTVVDSGTGTLSYSASFDNLDNYSGEYTWVNDHMDPHGGGAVGYEINTGTRNGDASIDCEFTRNVVCFEVLDYDSDTSFLLDNNRVDAVAVFYKKITITHSMPRTVTSTFNINSGSGQAGMLSSGGGFNDWPRDPTSEETTTTNTFSSTGTRKVEYILHVDVDGSTYSITLATFNGGIGTGSGQRCYGVVVKVLEKYVIVSYDLDNFVSDGGAQASDSYYDSPLNYEDWNKCGFNSIWTTSKRVIGIVSLNNSDNWGIDLYDEQDPIQEELYGIHMSSTTNTIEV